MEQGVKSYSKRLVAWVFLLACIVNVGAHLALLPQFDSHSRYFNEGDRLQVTPDGYYFLRMAADWGAGAYTLSDPYRPGLRPQPAPPLSVLASFAASVTGASLGNVAFFLPPILASLLTGLVLAIGLAAGSLRFGLCAAVLLVTSEAWFSRTALGVFDTDCLIPLIFFGLLYTLYRLHSGSWSWLLAVAGLSALLHYWWPQAGLPMAAFCIGVFALSAVFPGQGKKLVKTVLILMAAAALALTFSGSGASWGGWLGRFFASLDSHVRFLMGSQHAAFAQTGWTIEELMPMGFKAALNLLGGHWLLSCVSLVGVGFFLLARPLIGYYIIVPSLFFWVCSLVAGNRFIMFAALGYALGLGWLCGEIFPRCINTARRHTRNAVAFAVCSVVLAVGLWSIYDGHGVVPTYDASEVALARTVDKVADKDAAVWSWWGPGYMIQHFGKRETFFDGGLQGPKKAFIAALPLACDDPYLARNWIKFFSVHPNGLDRLAVHLGQQRAMEFLLLVMSRPQRLNELAGRYKVPSNLARQSWLFPERDVYLVLLGDMLLRNSWLSIGTWRPGMNDKREAPIFAFNLSEAGFDRELGILVPESGQRIQYSKLLFIGPDGLSHDNPSSVGPIVALVKGLDVGYVIPEDQFQAMAFQLLYIYPRSVPGFAPVSYNPFVGGIWRVY